MPLSFGKLLRQLRTEAGLGLRELAQQVKKSPGYLSDVENEKVDPPSVAVILDIVRVLGVDKRPLLEAARKLDPELTDYVVETRFAADFLRMAKEQSFEDEDWERLAKIAELSRLGRDKEPKP